MITLDATFVTSAASARGLPVGCRPQIALVGRSNVGKSSLINALTRSRVARTSAAPGKTQLANVYRIGIGGKTRNAEALFLVDLPGYGYARGGDQAAREFARLAAEYFGVAAPSGRLKPAPTRAAGGAGFTSENVGAGFAREGVGAGFAGFAREGVGAGFSRPDRPGPEAALLLVDSRHPGLETDLEAWRWLSGLPVRTAIVATKIDKLGRAERVRAIRAMERSFNSPVLPVSAASGEGMELLWKLITRLVSPHPSPETPA